MAKAHSVFFLVLLSAASSWARYLVPVDLCYPTQSKRCRTSAPAPLGIPSGGASPSTSASTTLGIPPGGASSAVATSILRGGKSSCRGGSTLAATRTMTASQMKMFNLFSGGAAGTIASCITNPLEVIKTQLQSSSAAVGELSAASGHPIAVARKIFERDGVFGFWKGMRPTLVGIIPARSVYFYTYEQTKRFLGSVVGMREGGVPNALASGLMAGIGSNTLTNPIWVVKTRLQLLADSTAGQKVYTGYRDAVKSILKEEGIGGFYKGISASYWGCLEGATQFMIYEQIKTRLIAQQNHVREQLGMEPTDKLPKLTYFLSAALAKGTAAILTYPHEVARTRMREQARNGVFKYKGMWQTIGVVAKEEGRKGLYSGMGVHLMKVVPNSAIMFLTYEVVNAWLGKFTVIEDE